MKRILFVSGKNMHRSKTAEDVFKDRGDIMVKSACLFKGSEVEVTREMVDWADMVFVMDKEDEKEMSERFHNIFERRFILCLEIPDIYDKDDPELEKEIRKKTRGYF